ncbi:MAG TPA: preprotein translocase subunit SecE [Candidatus Saccharimonadales bacterium]
MADKEQAKRRVKNPETFREKALKAAETDEQPSTVSRVKSASGKVTSPVTGPIGRLGRWLGKFKVFRIISRILVPKYFRQSYQELKLVTWPSWGESRRLTGAVLVFAIVFGGLVALVDFGLDKLFRNILLK